MEIKDKYVPLRHRTEVSRLEKSILDLWKDNSDQEFNAATIVAAMDKVGIAKYKTLRYLKRLVDGRSLERRSDKQQILYKLRLRPKEFNQIEYVTNLDSVVSSKHMSYEWGVGGAFSHLACGTIVGFPHVEKETDADVTFVLDILLRNVAEIFVSLEYLRDVILLRRAGVRIKIPDEVLRTLILQTYLTVLEEDLGETKAVADKLIPSLHYWKDVVEFLWKHNQSNVMDAADPNDGIVSMSMTESFEKLVSAKKYLKDEGVDISRYDVGELANKLRKIEQRTEEFTEAAFQRQESEGTEEKSVLLPEEMSEQHSLWGLAYSVKLAELYKSMGLREKQDMALVVTRSPRTMDTQTTEEHILLDFIEVGKENRELAHLTEEQRVRFLGRRFGEAYVNTPRQEIEKLRERPSLIQALGGHIDAFYEEYRDAWEKRVRIEEKLDRELYKKYGNKI